MKSRENIDRSHQVLTEAARLYGQEFVEFLALIGHAASRRNLPLYLIGGAVRDLLWGQRSEDIDFMVEGDAIFFVRELFERWEHECALFPAPKRPVVFPKYGTAKLQFPSPTAGGISLLDFSSARQESYPQPGAPPIVAPGNLRNDLERRDFTINALAVRVHPDHGGEVCDFFDGVSDLQSRTLRVLHDQSFIDDPARLLRAMRFSERFDCVLEARTAELFSDAVKYQRLQTLPPMRLFDEFRKVLAEGQGVAILKRLQSEQLLAQIHPKLRLSDEFLGREGEWGAAQIVERDATTIGGPTGNNSLTGAWRKALRLLFIDLNQSDYFDVLLSFGLSRAQIASIAVTIPTALGSLDRDRT